MPCASRSVLLPGAPGAEGEGPGRRTAPAPPGPVVLGTSSASRALTARPSAPNPGGRPSAFRRRTSTGTRGRSQVPGGRCPPTSPTVSGSWGCRAGEGGVKWFPGTSPHSPSDLVGDPIAPSPVSASEMEGFRWGRLNPAAKFLLLPSGKEHMHPPTRPGARGTPSPPGLPCPRTPREGALQLTERLQRRPGSFLSLASRFRVLCLQPRGSAHTSAQGPRFLRWVCPGAPRSALGPKGEHWGAKAGDSPASWAHMHPGALWLEDRAAQNALRAPVNQQRAESGGDLRRPHPPHRGSRRSTPPKAGPTERFTPPPRKQQLSPPPACVGLRPVFTRVTSRDRDTQRRRQ